MTSLKSIGSRRLEYDWFDGRVRGGHLGPLILDSMIYRHDLNASFRELNVDLMYGLT